MASNQFGHGNDASVIATQRRLPLRLPVHLLFNTAARVTILPFPVTVLLPAVVDLVVLLKCLAEVIVCAVRDVVAGEAVLLLLAPTVALLLLVDWFSHHRDGSVECSVLTMLAAWCTSRT
jgi:hypothetical protein